MNQVTGIVLPFVGAAPGLTTHTLRFYEQERLFFAPVRRDAAGRRVFTGEEVEWLKVCTKLRSSGMPLPEIRRYAELVVAGPGNETERFEILRRHSRPTLARRTRVQLSSPNGNVPVQDELAPYRARRSARRSRSI
jgi:DNA-binding transcriptional MerR regulator